MNVAIMQPYLFPYIGYFQLIKAVDNFILYDDVNFINRGWINRNNILVNGQATLFTFPLKSASQNKLINEIELLEGDKWKEKFLKTIELAYKKAPHFNIFFPVIKEAISNSYSFISELASHCLNAVINYLSLKTFIVPSSSIYNNRDLKGQYRILDICRQLNAEHYLNPPGGLEIYSRKLFEENGIQINFIKTEGISYKQHADPFVPNLSIIDVLMFNSPEYANLLLDQYKLI